MVSDKFAVNGWTKLTTQLSGPDVAKLIDDVSAAQGSRRLQNMTALERHLTPELKTELRSHGLRPTPIRGVSFIKTKAENWSLPWHQDRVVAMAKRHSDAGYTNWSSKSGIWHCEPPLDQLEKIAFLYIALDTVTARSGGIELARGSHHLGKIQAADIAKAVQGTKCDAPLLSTGESLLVSALTLHRSRANQTENPRRAIRLDFTK